MAKPSSLKPEDRTEEAVRRYLTYLKTPEVLVDHERLARAQQRVDRHAAAGDVVEHLKALASLERAQVVDEAPLRAAFVEAIPGWAEEHQISVELLRGFGVPDEVLVEAKLLSRKKAERDRARTRTRRTTTVVPSKEADGQPPTPPAATNGHGTLDAAEVAALVEGMPERGTPFTVADLAASAGWTKDAARSRVNRAVTAGLLDDIGVDDSDPNRRGKRPVLYERT